PSAAPTRPPTTPSTRATPRRRRFADRPAHSGTRGGARPVPLAKSAHWILPSVVNGRPAMSGRALRTSGRPSRRRAAARRRPPHRPPLGRRKIPPEANLASENLVPTRPLPAAVSDEPAKRGNFRAIGAPESVLDGKSLPWSPRTRARPTQVSVRGKTLLRSGHRRLTA